MDLWLMLQNILKTITFEQENRNFNGGKREMNGKEYQELAMRTNDGNATKRLLNLTLSDTTDDGIGEDTGTVLNACLGLSGEVGEFNDMIKKMGVSRKRIRYSSSKERVWRYSLVYCNDMSFIELGYG